MEAEKGREHSSWIFSLQVASVALIWVFVLGISAWILHLLRLAHRLDDVPGASVAISIVAIPVFITGASVLTYVFIGLQRGRRDGSAPATNQAGHGKAGLLVALSLSLGAGGAIGGSGALAAEAPALPDNPLAGLTLFESKECHRCHGLSGIQPGIAFDLGEGHFSGSLLDLGASLWNHVPSMSVTFEETGLSWPELSEQEAGRLLSFLYFIDYLGRPGEASEGARVFEERGCDTCHTLDSRGTTAGPDLAELTNFASPLYIAQAIWNHGPGMLESIREAGMRLPEFSEGDLADLAAYARQKASAGPRGRELLNPGNPNLGAGVFQSKGCASCHGGDARGGDFAPSLVDADLHRSAEGIAATMWNHALTMRTTMLELGIGWPELTTAELADLVAFLYFLPFSDPPGDPQEGAEIFSSRCGECHGDGAGADLTAPDLSAGDKIGSPASLVAAMWNHAPYMKEAILAEGLPWPELSGEDLRQLLAYLESEPEGP